MVVEITRARPEHVPGLVEVLARSFADDPIICWPFPTEGSHVEQCRGPFPDLGRAVRRERLAVGGGLTVPASPCGSHRSRPNAGARASARAGEARRGVRAAGRVPAVLETARRGNVGYHERLGFRVVADEQAPGAGPRLWFMRSDP
jgi:hypothetical protein